MIWFACPRCGKVHGRPNEATGTVVSCDCDQDLTVPAQDTVAALGSDQEAFCADPLVRFLLARTRRRETQEALRLPEEESAPGVAETPASKPMMIWFACKQCGKVHGRPENSSGTLIFCACGQGLTVPWESTVAEPEMVELADPLKFDASKPSPPPRSPDPRRRPERRRPDPHHCFNHQTLAAQQTCGDCGEAFCGDCLVRFQHQLLCGPCKNFRARLLQQPPRLSGLALVSLILALFTGPLGLCILPMVQGAPRAHAFALLALLPHLAALALGAAALRNLAKEPQACGRALALTALVTAGVAAILTIILTWYAPRGGWTV